MLNGLTAAQALLIFLVVLTALGLGAAFMGMVLFLNKRLNEEQRRAERAEEQHTGRSGGSGSRPGSGGGGGLLATAGGLVFSGDAAGNIVAYDAKAGKPLWHSRIGGVTNAPQTYMLDGKQYLLVAAGDTLYSFTLY